MYEYIKGNLIELNPTNAIIENNGVAYYIHISLQTYSLLMGQSLPTLYIHFVVREDEHVLFGFASKQERELFRMLISVSGVGAGTARMMLSAMSCDDIGTAIASENVSRLKSIKGIGLKTAERIIVDLKTRILQIGEHPGGFTFQNTHLEEAMNALLALGFQKSLSEKALLKAVKQNPHASVEEFIKFALREM
jgi:Holliday junction DNA helicase RuvA